MPETKQNLLSVQQLLRRHINVRFTKDKAILTQAAQDGGEGIEAEACWNGHGWILGTAAARAAANDTHPAARTSFNGSDSLIGWHERLGHLNFDDVIRLENHELAEGVHVTDKTQHTCEPCLLGKQPASKKAPTDTSESAPTDEIGSVFGIDIKTDVKPRDCYGNVHQFHVVDYGSSYGEVFPMKTKPEWFQHLNDFIVRFERQYDVKVTVIRGDNEFATKRLRDWCTSRGIRQQLTEPGESSSNGKAERRHRTMFEGMRASMYAVPSAPRFLWSKATQHHS
ncbi:TPA: hypothetical protein N0F65_002903 [Lagenidium giganteum]|uniref:Integrase catalytic domain-containing protein n=1 Tax=Lagenidium giganteum TaxID=4803 RepID=A0AAV2Z828_9STRA|nr:TPA: hypothetical protein N0F65_002903 [Lagenidium giganteum]